MESGFLSQILLNRHLNLNCKNTELKNSLLENKNINSIFNFSKKSSDFSPIIECKTKNNLTSININFQSSLLIPEMIEECFEFCHNLRNSKI